MNRKEKKKTERVNRLNIADEILVCNNMLKFIEGILRYPAVIRPTLAANGDLLDWYFITQQHGIF